ncbi:Uma2 family endonuclease [Pedobacter frigiditerrae]|uniref:Uma2 family endonuclease n=1 Tax=Pedobacter frigiditerrae TaxID=2530452 RepID=A0A4R0MQX5_9SPHI|nr:Uma2 family endonuclease [Pedobacter frigiditerrae]TCC89311.1 Uma2 family endonuclease [Pedobacter frigiditerrae]
MSTPKPYPTEEDFPIISNVNEIDYSATYSYANYMRFTFDERMEIIKGHIFKMSAPNRYHQKTFGIIFNRLYNFLEGDKCEVYGAPFDVRLPKKSKEDKDIFTVVQPDVVVVCDQSKLDKRGCIGAPDIVVEILSPGNNKKELQNKYEVYEEAGVKEYWIVSISDETFFKYVLNEEGKFMPTRLLTVGDKVTTLILPGFVLDLEQVFKN